MALVLTLSASKGTTLLACAGWYELSTNNSRVNLYGVQYRLSNWNFVSVGKAQLVLSKSLDYSTAIGTSITLSSEVETTETVENTVVVSVSESTPSGKSQIPITTVLDITSSQSGIIYNATSVEQVGITASGNTINLEGALTTYELPEGTQLKVTYNTTQTVSSTQSISTVVENFASGGTNIAYIPIPDQDVTGWSISGDGIAEGTTVSSANYYTIPCTLIYLETGLKVGLPTKFALTVTNSIAMVGNGPDKQFVVGDYDTVSESASFGPVLST